MQRLLRLRHRDDFRRLRKHGMTWRHPFLILSVIPNQRTHNRYGFITTKQLGKAVARNRIRRLLREAVRHAHPQLRTGYDIVMIARKTSVGQPYDMLRAAVEQVLQDAGLWDTATGENAS
jgi:ribonuclease P protein component